MAKNILTARLKKLVEQGILEKVPAADGRAYQEYVATQAGRDLYKVLVAMREWGAKHFGMSCGEKHVLVDRVAQKPVAPLEVRSSDGRVLEVDDLQVVPSDDVTSSDAR